MKEEILKHKLAYLILALGLLGLVSLFLLAWPNRDYQKSVALAISIFYFAWGVITHTKTNHLTIRIIAEYAVISTLAGALLWLMLW